MPSFRFKLDTDASNIFTEPMEQINLLANPAAFTDILDLLNQIVKLDPENATLIADENEYILEVTDNDKLNGLFIDTIFEDDINNLNYTVLLRFNGTTLISSENTHDTKKIDKNHNIKNDLIFYSQNIYDVLQELKGLNQNQRMTESPLSDIIIGRRSSSESTGNNINSFFGENTSISSLGNSQLTNDTARTPIDIPRSAKVTPLHLRPASAMASESPESTNNLIQRKQSSSSLLSRMFSGIMSPKPLDYSAYDSEISISLNRYKASLLKVPSTANLPIIAKILNNESISSSEIDTLRKGDLRETLKITLDGKSIKKYFECRNNTLDALSENFTPIGGNAI